MTNTPRLHHFDVIKGIAIFLVVMGHVLTICIRDIDQAFVFNIIAKVHMPLFFFISGYFTYKISSESKTFAPPKLWTRFKQLIIPFFVVSIFWIYYYPHSGIQYPLNSTWHGLYFSMYKNGYWFTLALFEIILIYYAISPLLRKAKNIWIEIFIVITSWIPFFTLSAFIVSYRINSLFGIAQIVDYFPIFIVGVFAKKHITLFNSVAENKKLYTAALIIGICFLYLLMNSWKYPFMQGIWSYPISILFKTCLAIIAIHIIKPWCENAYSTERERAFQLKPYAVWNTSAERVWQFTCCTTFSFSRSLSCKSRYATWLSDSSPLSLWRQSLQQPLSQ